MKKSTKIAIILLIVAVLGTVAIIFAVSVNRENDFSNSTVNTFSLEAIDDYSPDRKIIFYADGREIDQSKIVKVSFEDGLVLCDGEPFVVNVFELEDIDKLVITMSDNETYILTKTVGKE